jgi:hypothetical protein
MNREEIFTTEDTEDAEEERRKPEILNLRLQI